MKRKILILATFCLIYQCAIGQTATEKQAFESYKEGRDAFESKKFLEAAELLYKTKELLGSTNVRIQPMLIKALCEIKDWQRAVDEINAYIELEPNEELVEYQEVRRWTAVVIKELNEEETFIGTKNKTEEFINAYLDRFPYGRYRNEAISQYNNLQYLKRWNPVSKEDPASLRRFIVGNKDNPYSVQAKRLLVELEESLWSKAVNANKMFNYQNYLKEFPNGSYKDNANEAIELIEAKKRREMYISHMKLAKDYKKTASKYTGKGVLNLTLGVAGIVGGAYLLKESFTNDELESEKGQLFLISGILLSGVGIGGIAFRVFPNFKSAGTFKKREKGQLKEASKYVEIRPMVNGLNHSMGVRVCFSL